MVIIGGKTKGLNGSELKYIAIFAMLLDHIAWLFIPSDTALAIGLHFIGRTTAPIMCFFISEGYHYTRNIRRYFIRMAVFAVISHFAYAFCFRGSFFAAGQESVIATLTFCLLAVHVYNSTKISNAFKLPIILLIAHFAKYCDWGAFAVIFTLVFEISRGSKKRQLLAYSLTALLYVLPNIKQLINGSEGAVTSIYKVGVFLPILLLALYNGERGGGKFSKWLFYVFYPAHMILLGYISFRYG